MAVHSVRDDGKNASGPSTAMMTSADISGQVGGGSGNIENVVAASTISIKPMTHTVLTPIAPIQWPSTRS